MPQLVAPRLDDRPRLDDDGFSVLEVVVAIALVTIVMTSLAAFFVNSGRVTDAQSLKQTAVQVATDAVNKARSLTSVGLATGRDQSTSATQWAQGQDTSATTKFPGVATYLGTTASPRLAMAYDTTATTGSGSSSTTALPTNGRTVSIDNMTFTQNWFLGYCLPSGTNCTPGSATATNSETQVVVDVTWTGNACPNSLCSYVTSTLVNAATDPVFDGGQSASRPVVNNPGAQSTAYKSTANLTLTVTGGTAPYTWSASGLPPGLTLNSGSSVAITGKPTSAGTFSARVTATDSFGYVSTAGFTWTTSGPTINAVADQTATVGSPDTTTATVSGGTSPYTWSASGLPTGITLTSSGSTATMSGTPTVGGKFNVVVTMTDAAGYTDSEPFMLSVSPSITNVSTACSTTKNASGYYTCTSSLRANGANGPYTWTGAVGSTTINPTATGDSSTATATAQTTTAGTYTYTATAKDSDGLSGSVTITWKFGP